MRSWSVTGSIGSPPECPRFGAFQSAIPPEICQTSARQDSGHYGIWASLGEKDGRCGLARKDVQNARLRVTAPTRPRSSPRRSRRRAIASPTRSAQKVPRLSSTPRTLILLCANGCVPGSQGWGSSADGDRRSIFQLIACLEAKEELLSDLLTAVVHHALNATGRGTSTPQR